MIIPNFLNLFGPYFLGMGIDLSNYTSTTSIYGGDMHRVEQNVSYESVRYMVTEDPTDVLHLLGVPSDLAIRFLDNSAILNVWSESSLRDDLEKFWKSPEVILAVNIIHTTKVEKLSPETPANVTLHPHALESTHYVAEVGWGNQVLAMIGFRPSHPDDISLVRAVVEHRMGGSEGNVRDNITEAISLILQDLKETPRFRGPVFLRQKIIGPTRNYGGDVNDLPHLVPLLRNYTLQHSTEADGGIGVRLWLRLESMTKINASLPRVERWTVLTEYKEQMFRRLVPVFLDLRKALEETHKMHAQGDLNEEQQQIIYNWLLGLEDDRSKIVNLARQGSIFGKTSMDLKLLKAAERYRTYSFFSYTRSVRRLAEELGDLPRCNDLLDPNQPTRGLPRTVLQIISSNITTLDGCASVCAQDPKCRLSAVGALATDPSHVRCWTFHHSLAQHTFLGPLEVAPGSLFLSRECIAAA